MSRSCRHCGADISHRSQSALSCEECRRTGARHKAPRPACMKCGGDVIGRSANARTCTACFEAGSPIRFAESRRCVVCATAFAPLATNQLTCGSACKYLRHKFGPRASAALLITDAPRPCEVCSEVFTPSSRAAVTCSRRCARLRWARANPMAVHRRRAKMRDGHVLQRDWERLVNRHDHRCAYCGTRGPLAADHVVPLSRGGRHTIGNLLPACKSCNSRKHTKFLVEWRKGLALAA